MNFTTTEHKASPCPNCAAIICASTGELNQTPEQGDFSVCFSCGAILRYGADLVMINATSWDLLDTGLDRETRQKLIKISRTIKDQVIRRRRRTN